MEKHITNQAEGQKNNLIANLVNSRSYAATHTAISQLNEVGSWSEEQLKVLYEAACNNGQVCSIIDDSDVRLFYAGLLKNYEFRDDNAKCVEKLLNS